MNREGPDSRTNSHTGAGWGVRGGQWHRPEETQGNGEEKQRRMTGQVRLDTSKVGTGRGVGVGGEWRAGSGDAGALVCPDANTCAHRGSPSNQPPRGARAQAGKQQQTPHTHALAQCGKRYGYLTTRACTRHSLERSRTSHQQDGGGTFIEVSEFHRLREGAVHRRQQVTTGRAWPQIHTHTRTHQWCRRWTARKGGEKKESQKTKNDCSPRCPGSQMRVAGDATGTSAPAKEGERRKSRTKPNRARADARQRPHEGAGSKQNTRTTTNEKREELRSSAGEIGGGGREWGSGRPMHNHSRAPPQMLKVKK